MSLVQCVTTLCILSFRVHSQIRKVGTFFSGPTVKSHLFIFYAPLNSSQLGFSSLNYTHVGTFEGNSDRNTEVVQKLVNVHTGKVGIRAAEFRFQPLSKAEGGFKNRKAMRVAFYGTPRESTEPDEDAHESQSPKGKSGASRLFDRNTNGVFFHIARDEHSSFGVRENTQFYKLDKSKNCKLTVSQTQNVN